MHFFMRFCLAFGRAITDPADAILLCCTRFSDCFLFSRLVKWKFTTRCSKMRIPHPKPRNRRNCHIRLSNPIVSIQINKNYQQFVRTSPPKKMKQRIRYQSLFLLLLPSISHSRETRATIFRNDSGTVENNIQADVYFL